MLEVAGMLIEARLDSGASKALPRRTARHLVARGSSCVAATATPGPAPPPAAESASEEPLSPEDARILALEVGAVCGHTCKVIVFGGEHGAAAVRAHLSRRLDTVPRLRERLAPPPAPLAWVDDPSFSLERHVVDRGRADDIGLRRLMAEPLARERPLWAMDVVSPLAGGRTALVWRIHHALADGMTAMRMTRELLLEPGPSEPRRRAPGPAERAPSARPPSAVAPVATAARLPATLRRELRRRGSATALSAARRDAPDDVGA